MAADPELAESMARLSAAAGAAGLARRPATAMNRFARRDRGRSRSICASAATLWTSSRGALPLLKPGLLRLEAGAREGGKRAPAKPRRRRR